MKAYFNSCSNLIVKRTIIKYLNRLFPTVLMAPLKMVSLPTTTKTASVYALFWYICNAGVPQQYQFVVCAAVFFLDNT